MSVSTFTQPDYTAQSGAAYKGNLDGAADVLKRLAASFAPHAQSTPDMTVRLDAGAIFDGTTLTEVAAQSTGTITAPSANPRIDRLVVDQLTGVVSVITGTEDASPTAPAITAGKVPVAQVSLVVSQSSIVNADITDERQLGVLGLGAAANKTDIPNVADVQTGEIAYAADAGSTDAYAITLTPAPSAYTTGMVINFKANTVNTGTATLNVNSLGAKTIKKLHDQDLEDGDIEAGQLVTVIYDGTNLQMQSQTAAAGGGVVKQVVSTQTGALSTGTTTVPTDDTIPQKTEGDEYLTLSITPKNTSNRLVIEAIVQVAHSVGGRHTVSLFQDAIADALATISTNAGSSDETHSLPLRHVMTAGTTSATTYKIRIGSNIGGTTTLNGTAGARLYGGVFASILKITEIEP